MGKILNELHIQVHAMRNLYLQNNTPATIFEQKLNKIIAEAFANDCSECKDTTERLKYTQVQPTKQSWIGGLFK